MRAQITEGIQTTVQPNELQPRDKQWIEIAWHPFPEHTFRQFKLAGATCPFPVNSRNKPRMFWVSVTAEELFLVLA